MPFLSLASLSMPRIVFRLGQCWSDGLWIDLPMWTALLDFVDIVKSLYDIAAVPAARCVVVSRLRMRS